MRALLASTVAVACWASCALAADAVTSGPDPAVPPVAGAPAIYIWSGPYAGAFVGYNAVDVHAAGAASFDGDGAVGGLYAGYNLQTDRLIYGLEADLGVSGADAGGFDATAGLPIEADSNAFGSLRGRVGVAVDPFMAFATAGAAVSNGTLSLGAATDSKTHLGYTVGAGVEAKITDRVGTRLEYRYSDFDSRGYDLGTTTTSAGFDEHSVRAGIALKF